MTYYWVKMIQIDHIKNGECLGQKEIYLGKNYNKLIQSGRNLVF